MINFTVPYIVAFVLVLITLGLNEYRLLKIKSIDYKSFVNSVSMLIVSLLTFSFCHAIINKLFNQHP